MNEFKPCEEFLLPQDLSAMAKTFFVQTQRPLRDGDRFINKGSTVTGVKVIAAGDKIRDVQRLVETFPLPNGEKTEAADWLKCRGTAIITNGTQEKRTEIHWYQCVNIGKVEFKEKFGVTTMLIRYKGEKCFSFIVGKVYVAKSFYDERGEARVIFDEGDDWYRYGIRFVEKNFEVVAEDEQEISRAV